MEEGDCFSQFSRYRRAKVRGILRQIDLNHSADVAGLGIKRSGSTGSECCQTQKMNRLIAHKWTGTTSGALRRSEQLAQRTHRKLQRTSGHSPKIRARGLPSPAGLRRCGHEVLCSDRVGGRRTSRAPQARYCVSANRSASISASALTTAALNAARTSPPWVTLASNHS